MESFTLLLGKSGLILVIGIAFFTWCYINGQKLFQWIEDQTAGTRNYIMKQLNFLHWEVQEKHVTYILLSISFGLAFFVFTLFAIFVHFGLGFFLAPIVFIVGWKVPRPFINYLVQRRIKQYQGQMVDALNLLSNGLRAGLSVPQSLGMVVDELSPPIAQEFNLVLQENRMGIPLEECFENLAKRITIEDNQMFVTSINILRETGGNLPETFDTIVSVIRERIRLQQKIDTYIASNRMQAIIICSMPFVITVVMGISDPSNMKMIFTTIPGWIAILLGIGLDLIGGIVIMKIINIKI